MRRFRFRLQPILHLREYEEQEKKLALGTVTGECSRLRDQISSRDHERRRALREIPSENLADISYRVTLEEYTRRLQIEQERIGGVLEKREAQRILAAQDYGTARQKAEVLRKLREHREDAFRRDQLRAQQIVLDETARNIHLQKEVKHG